MKFSNIFRTSYGVNFISMMASLYPGWHFMHRWIYGLFVGGPNSPNTPA